MLTCRRLRRAIGYFLGMAALVAGTATSLQAQRVVFRSATEMVPLIVTVTDAKGKYVTSLADRDFEVLEDGVPQSVSFFSSDPTPVDLALLVDASSSMRSALPLVRKAAHGLVSTLRAGDRATILALNTVVGVVQSLTNDQVEIDGAIDKLAASGDTALYDGLYVVLKDFQRAHSGATEIRKQVIVLLSDGLDTRSRLGVDEVMETARRAGVSLYIIATPGPSSRLPRTQQDGQVLQSEYVLRTLAREAGGLSFFPKTIRELPAIYASIAQELATQYALGYQPVKPQGDGAFRRVAVRVMNAVARTRSGYYAERVQARSE